MESMLAERKFIDEHKISVRGKEKIRAKKNVLGFKKLEKI